MFFGEGYGLKRLIICSAVLVILLLVFGCEKPAVTAETPVVVVVETVVEESASVEEPDTTELEVVKEESNELEKAEIADNIDIQENGKDVATSENIQIIENDETATEDSSFEEDLYYDADIPEDFEFAAHDEDYVEPVGAFCRNLNELKYLNEPMLFRNDLDAYLIYYIPTIDKEYDTYVISGTEKLSGSSHIFKIRVEGIMEGDQDLEIECRKKDGHKHFDFFSDLSPEGTEEINWGAGLIDDSDFK